MYSKYTYYHSYYSPKEEDERDGIDEPEMAAVGAADDRSKD
jgi:hypothetical protein